MDLCYKKRNAYGGFCKTFHKIKYVKDFFIKLLNNSIWKEMGTNK